MTADAMGAHLKANAGGAQKPPSVPSSQPIGGVVVGDIYLTPESDRFRVVEVISDSWWYPGAQRKYVYQRVILQSLENPMLLRTAVLPGVDAALRDDQSPFLWRKEVPGA